MKAGTEPPGHAEPSVLRMSSVSVRYPGSRSDAIRNVALDLTREKAVIVGGNGSGKTTLFRVILGLAPISAGTIHVLGQNVASVRGETRVATNLEEVYRLMTVPVSKLISIWSELKGGSEREVRAWFERFALNDVLDRPLFRLSTGQAKLVGDLLALAYSPQLVLLDEPFDNVDFRRRTLVVELLKRTEAVVMMSTHELDLLGSFPDWSLFFMFDGQLVGRFRADQLDRLFVSRGRLPGALATFPTVLGDVSITLDQGEAMVKSVTNLEYLLDRLA